MNTNLNKWSITGLYHRLAARRPKRIFAGVLFILIIWFLVSSFLIEDNFQNGVESVFYVKRGPLIISVTEPGNINNREKVIIKSKVEGKTTITYLISEGAHVKKGDLLIKLDASHLEDKKMQQQITVLNAEAAYIRARENLAVARSQANSDIAKAKLDYSFAKVDRNKYLKGEYPQELQRVEAEITVAREELQRAEDKLEWSRRLYSEGYITRTELQADELAAKRKDIDVQLAASKLELLQKYTHKRAKKDFRSKVTQAKMALERVERKVVADTIQAQAELKAKESEFKRQQVKLEKISEQIAECRITAPVDGMVVYATTGRSKRFSKEPMKEGMEVIEGKQLIYLPTTSSMTAEVNIRESSLLKVRQGMPVRVTVDAMPGKLFSGRVGKIDLLPDSYWAWLNPGVKVYRSEIYLDENDGLLRPGMTCRVEIIVEEYADTIYIPVQAVVRVKDKHVVYLAESKGPEYREVKIGMDNDRMIRIIEGLEVGEKVLLAPPLAPSEAPLQQASPTGPTPKGKLPEVTLPKVSVPEQM